MKNKTFLIGFVLLLGLMTVVGAAVYKYRWPIYKYGLLVFLYPPMPLSELGHGGPASKLILFHPGGIARDDRGTLYVSDRGEDVTGGRPFQGSVIWRVDQTGIAHAIAGSGRQGQPSTSVPALEAALNSVETMVFDDQGRLLFVDAKHAVVSRIEPNGILTRLAGNGEWGYSGDGGPALKATFNRPYDIAIDVEGNLYIADAENHAVRIVSLDGIIDTFAGTGTPGYSGDGGPADEAQLNKPYNIAVDPQGGLLIGDSGNHVIRRADEHRVITTIVGIGEAGYAGDGGDALAALLDGPQYIQMVGDWLFVGDEHNHAIRMVDPDGIITTVIGNGEPGFSLDGTLASKAQIYDPEGFLVELDGTMFVLDSGNHRVLRIDNQGRVWNFAGRGRETERLGCSDRFYTCLLNLLVLHSRMFLVAARCEGPQASQRRE